MPLFIQPSLRARQEAMESDGLIQTRDSALVTIYKSQESAGTKPKIVPQITIISRNTNYKAK
jgi:hypothetical protein